MAEDSGDNKVTLSLSDLDNLLEKAMGKAVGKALEHFEERLEAVTTNVNKQLAKLNLTSESKDAEILSREKQPLGESEPLLGEGVGGSHDAIQGNWSVAQLLNGYEPNATNIPGFQKTIKFPKFKDGMLWEDFEMRFMSVAKLQGIHHYFDPSYKDPVGMSKETKIKVDQLKYGARAVLMNQLLDSHVSIYRSVDDGLSPLPIWNAMTTHFNDLSSHAQASVLEDFINLRQKESMSLVEYIDTFNLTVKRITTPLTDQLIRTKFLSGLQMAYASERRDLERSPESSTYAQVCQVLLRYHRREFGDPTISIGEAAGHLDGKGGPSAMLITGECFNCGAKGHFARDCKEPCKTCKKP